MTDNNLNPSPAAAEPEAPHSFLPLGALTPLPSALTLHIFTFLSCHDLLPATEVSHSWQHYINALPHWQEAVLSRWTYLKILPSSLIYQLERSGVSKDQWYHQIYTWKCYDDAVEGNGGAC